MITRPTNWAGNVTFTAHRLHHPTSLAELQLLVASSERIRALGTGHSFNRIADCAGDQVSVLAMPRLIEIDSEREAVKVSAGITYGELAAQLHASGLALRNLGSLPHISVAGACATGTHGSGTRNGNLATAVNAIEMVTAGGDVVGLSREADGDRFLGAVVGLGALGIVTTLTLDVVPTFTVRQYVYDGLPRDQLVEHLDTILSSDYSVSLFTDWRGAGVDQVWLKRDGDANQPPASRWLGMTLADGPRHPVPGMPTGNCTQQLGVPGPWHERLPHFRAGRAPSSGEELQSEYLLPRRDAAAALGAIQGIHDRVAAVLQISEIRTVAADELWLSPSYQQDTVAIHFTWVKDERAVVPVLGMVEERLAPFGARPHWGKLFSTPPDVVARLYPRLADFRRLMLELDPAGRFGNDMLARYLMAGG